MDSFWDEEFALKDKDIRRDCWLGGKFFNCGLSRYDLTVVPEVATGQMKKPEDGPAWRYRKRGGFVPINKLMI